jgi:Ca2+-binding EF-hand superfamily protein
MSDRDFEDILTYFNNFDSKKNGVLDYSEFARLISDIGFQIDEKELKKGFDKIDTDHNNEIDFEEFMAWWGEQQ